jgi:hypothetical protein
MYSETLKLLLLYASAAAGDSVEDALQLTKQWLGPDADYASISVGGEQDEAAPVTGQQSNLDQN